MEENLTMPQFVVVRVDGDESCFVAHLTGASGAQVAIYDLVPETLPIHQAVERVRALSSSLFLTRSGTDVPLSS